MGHIQSLVENENSTKLQNRVILTYVRSFLAYVTEIVNIVVVKVRRIIKYFIFSMENSKMSINRSEETTVELATQSRKSFVFLH